MSFERPSLRQLFQRISRDFSGRLQAGEPLIPNSAESVLAKIWAGLGHMLFGFLEYIFKQIFPDTAEEYYLRRWAAMWGMTPNRGGLSSGRASFQADAGYVIPAGYRLRGKSNALFYRTKAESQLDGGYAVVELEAEAAGAAYNLAAGEALSLVEPLSGVRSDGAVLDDGISGGAEAEQIEPFRARYLARLRRPPRGGAKHDYVAWAKEVPGVTRAWAYPLGAGLGTVTLCFVCDGLDDIFPTDEMVKRVQEHIDELKPGDMYFFQAFRPERLEVPIRLKVKPDTEAMRTAVTAEVTDYADSQAEPEVTLYLKDLRAAVNSANGLKDYVLLEPAENIHVPAGYYPVLAPEFEPWSGQ